MSEKVKFRHSDKWGVVEQEGTFKRWVISKRGVLSAEIKSDKIIPSIGKIIIVPYWNVDFQDKPNTERR